MFNFKKQKNSKKHKEYKEDKKSEANISHEIFTYFIPAPPTRPMGYREKDFDGICKTIISHDLSLKILKTIPHTNGLWVMISIKGEAERITHLFNNTKLKEYSIDSNLDVDDTFSQLIERD